MLEYFNQFYIENQGKSQDIKIKEFKIYPRKNHV